MAEKTKRTDPSSTNLPQKAAGWAKAKQAVGEQPVDRERGAWESIQEEIQRRLEAMMYPEMQVGEPTTELPQMVIPYQQPQMMPAMSIPPPQQAPMPMPQQFAQLGYQPQQAHQLAGIQGRMGGRGY